MKDRLKCKARCSTYGQTVELRHSLHNHANSFKGQYEDLSSQILNIQHAKVRSTRYEHSS